MRRTRWCEEAVSPGTWHVNVWPKTLKKVVGIVRRHFLGNVIGCRVGDCCREQNVYLSGPLMRITFGGFRPNSHRTWDATHNATQGNQANGTCCHQWECSHCMQAASKEKRTICVRITWRVLCELGLRVVTGTIWGSPTERRCR